jgi:hypothetical protein
MTPQEHSEWQAAFDRRRDAALKWWADGARYRELLDAGVDPDVAWFEVFRRPLMEVVDVPLGQGVLL